MKAWSWFAVPPVMLAMAYMATPTLLANLSGRNVVMITLPDLPVGADHAKVKLANETASEREIRYEAFGGQPQNGFIPKGNTASVAQEFALQSILVTDTDEIAVVNGNLVRQGDKVGGGYRVFRIAPLAVWLEADKPSRFKVLHFPEYREVAMALTIPPETMLPVVPNKALDLIELEKNYQQILEKLKL